MMINDGEKTRCLHMATLPEFEQCVEYLRRQGRVLFYELYHAVRELNANDSLI